MRVLILYDSLLGHDSSKVRGLQLKDSLPQFEVLPTFQDIRDTNGYIRPLEEICSVAAKNDLVYTIKVSSYLLYETLISAGVKTVFDFADSLWTTSHQRCGWHNLFEILKISSAVVCENRFLDEVARYYNGKTFVLSSASYVERFTEISVEKDISLGWVGGQGTADGIRDLMERTGLAVYTLGDKSQYDEQKMLDTVSRFQTGLFPIPIDLEDYIYRGAYKALIYMSAGAVPICWKDGVCADIIEDGITGFLIEDEESWLPTITKASDPETSKNIRSAGYEYVWSNNSLPVIAKQLSCIFKEVLT